MNRTAFSLPDKSEYRTHGGLAITRVVEQFTGGANRLDDLIDLLDRRRGVVLSSGTTVPGRYESFDLGFSDPPLALETSGVNFVLKALNAGPVWPIGEVKRDEAKGQPGVRNPNFAIPIVGPLGPFYDFMGVELDQQSQAIVGKDSIGRERWRVPLRDPSQNNLIVYPMNPQSSQARVNGHVMLISMGYQVLAIDTLGGVGGERDDVGVLDGLRGVVDRARPWV